MSIAADQNCLVVLDISRSDLHTYRNSAHLRLTELPARALVGIIHFYAEVGKNVFQCKCLVQNALFLLLDRHDHNLGRSDSRRQHQTVVIAVYHDDRTDHTGGHTPGGLMNILQGVVLCCILDAKCLCKAVTKIMAGSGLQCFSVMHQGLDGVGSLCACKFLFISLLTADYRNSQHLLTEICIEIQHLDGSLLCLLRSGVGGMSLLP